MVFNRFTIQVAVRLLLIAVTMFAAIWSFFQTEIIMSPLGFGLLTIAQMVMLFYYINRTRDELLVFFKSFDNRDFNKVYNEFAWGQSKDELKVAFNNVLRTFKKLTLEREEQYQYLQMVNEHVSVGLISFKADGRVDLMNSAAQDLLGVPALGKIDQLANHDEGTWDKLKALKAGDSMVLSPNASKSKLAVVSRSFKLAEEDYTLISLQDISAELEEREMDAWQKLIRVLTHEIMNSVTPVVSLTTAIKMIMQDDEGRLKADQFEKDDLEDVFKSIVAIEKRGRGLLGFVQAYRDYTKPPVPEISRVNLFSLIHDTVQISKSELGSVKLNLLPHLLEDAFVQADEKLISQVLINLIKNAAEAMEGQPDAQIDITTEQEGGNTYIQVADNGPGIPDEIINEIFVPFFTTKKQGNGIGLSLSKQIMKAHKGDITLSTDSQGTVFSLKF
ncbi:PAS domain-containing sensor histidine kinase [Roseivirga sp. E12]|uniref:sensor histidine kinase n=1 Tax=Roseivirga sp. E12 TaxID=2819237 RepID=UPI001ABBF156|nr:ATP-binding protein [Roseivirga sp. E12]MBO3699679.1 GHKL domain-containing protein [Roseivirga sp. E12]